MIRARVYFGFLTTLIIPCAAWTGFYKCEVDGKTVYSDKQCVTGDIQEIEVDTRSTGFDLNPYYEAEESQLIEEYRKKNSRMKQAQEIAADRYEREKTRDKTTCEYYKSKIEYYEKILRRGYRDEVHKQYLKSEIALYRSKAAKAC